MSKEFLNLKNLIKQNILCLEFKKNSVKMLFGLWIYWSSETRNPKVLWKFFFWGYWLLSSEFFWVSISVLFAILKGKVYLFMLLVPFVLNLLERPWGRFLLTRSAQNDEVLFDDLWVNGHIAIMSTKTHEGTRGQAMPDTMIVPPQDWRMSLDRLQ